MTTTLHQDWGRAVWDHLDDILRGGRSILSCICCWGKKCEHVALALPLGSGGICHLRWMFATSAVV